MSFLSLGVNGIGASALILCLASLSAQQRPIAQGINLYSYEKEAGLGAQLAQHMREQTTAIESATIQTYVERLGRQLAAQLPGVRFPFTFTVIKDDRGGRTHEPVALPGGFIFVPAGLILAAQSEAELAGMLAHAMAHVVARHGTRAATKAQIANQSAIPLIFVGSWTANGQEDLMIPAAVLAAQRGYELDADRLAIRTMAAAGYDPAALIRYIDRTRSPRTAVQETRSALPAVADRLAALGQAVQELPAGAYSTGDGLASIQAEIRRLDPPPKPPPLLR